VACYGVYHRHRVGIRVIGGVTGMEGAALYQGRHKAQDISFNEHVGEVYDAWGTGSAQGPHPASQAPPTPTRLCQWGRWVRCLGPCADPARG
jgi:hypothetical protein